MKFFPALAGLLLGTALGQAEQPPAKVAELLDFYCYDCHGYGKSEGDIDLDDVDFSQGFEPHGDLWERVWDNVRSGIMPPAEGMPLLPEEKQVLLTWLEEKALGIDRDHPDPGRVTVRRHNRTEYEHTIRDLTGIRIRSAEHFPPDDTGYGFDTIGDVLTISPLLAERYLEAARAIMKEAVPDNAGRKPSTEIWAPGFVDPDNPDDTGRFIEFNRPQTVAAKRWLSAPGKYQLHLDFKIQGEAKGDDREATLVLKVDGKEVARQELHSGSSSLRLEKELTLDASEHTFALELLNDGANSNQEGGLGVAVEKLRVIGPGNAEELVYPDTYRRVIAKSHQTENREEWPAATRVVLRDFASKAWRRPVAESILDQLCDLADQAAAEQGSFEAGIRQGCTAILASPRFLLRAEKALPKDGESHYPLIDEWSLASRLSYFLWSSLPDEELRQLAANGQLRENLDAQIDRLLADPKAERFTENFVGQWLQARDVETVGMRPEVVLNTRFAEGQRIFNGSLRSDMRAETEMLFKYILDSDQPATDLVAGDYTFLNKRLADFYGIPGVKSERLEKVSGHRGGILTQGTFLVVTSNPTRTSPVKRGLYVLENLLGTPPPPAPPGIPSLEESAKDIANLSMREQMVAHRENPDCRSCHARMDPIGLAFENYTALGNFRQRDGKNAIDTSGELVTGEEFAGVEELKTLLATEKKTQFQRCLAEKLLTYGMGRGVEYYDAPAIDGIVTRMEENNGSLREAVKAVIHSTPFQRRRTE